MLAPCWPLVRERGQGTALKRGDSREWEPRRCWSADKRPLWRSEDSASSSWRGCSGRAGGDVAGE